MNLSFFLSMLVPTCRIVFICDGEYIGEFSATALLVLLLESDVWRDYHVYVIDFKAVAHGFNVDCIKSKTLKRL